MQQIEYIESEIAFRERQLLQWINNEKCEPPIGHLEFLKNRIAQLWGEFYKAQARQLTNDTNFE